MEARERRGRPAALIVAFVASFLAPLSAQDDAESKTRIGLLASIDAKKSSDVARSLKGRDGEFFDLVLSATSADPAALEECKRLLPVLPPPERKGLTELTSALLAADADERTKFALAYGRLRGIDRRTEDPAWKGPERDAAFAELRRAIAECRVGKAYLDARTLIAEAPVRVMEPDLRSLEAAAFAAKEEFLRLGDRLREAAAMGLWAPCLLARFDGEKAIAARDGAQAVLIECGAPHDRGPIANLLGTIDLVLAEGFLDDGRTAASLAASARAQAMLKRPTPSESLRLTIVLADARQETSGAPAALSYAGQLASVGPMIDDPKLLIEAARVGSRVYRRANKPSLASQMLARCRMRAKSIGATERDEAILAYLSALALGAEGKDEAATVAFISAADLADKSGDPYLRRCARAGRGMMVLVRGSETDAKKLLESALEISAGGPTIDRFTSAAFKLAYGEALVDKKRTTEALTWLAEATTVCNELGCSYEELPGRADMIAPDAQEPLRSRLFRGLRELSIKPSWEGFEPVYNAFERSRYEDMLRYLPDDGAVDEAFRREVEESEARVARLRRSLMIGRKPPSEEEAANVRQLRLSLKTRAATRSGAYALRKFPQPATNRRARATVCGARGLVLGFFVEEKGGFVCGFSNETFRFHVLPATFETKKHLETFKKTIADPKSTADAIVGASAPLWNEMIKPLLPVIENKVRVSIYVGDDVDDVPFEALTPSMAKGDLGTLPYLGTQYAVGRILTASMAEKDRTDRAGFRWLENTRLTSFAAKSADELKPLGKDFKEKVAYFTASEAEKGAAKPSFRDAALVVGPGFPQKHLDWNSTTAPSLVALFDPPEAPRKGMDPVRTLLGRGSKAAYLPTEKCDPEMVEALLGRSLALLSISGDGPLEALKEARAALVAGTLSSSKPMKVDYRHPAHWTKYRAFVLAP
jgi:hypothetical protein